MNIDFLNALGAPNDKQSYLKLSIKNFKLMKHVKIQNFLHNLNPLNLNVISQILAGSSSVKCQKTILKQQKFYDRSTVSSFFSQDENSWNCVKIKIGKDDVVNAKIKFQLSIPKQEEKFANFVVDIAAGSSDIKEDTKHVPIKIEEPLEKKSTEGKLKSIKLPYEIIPIELSITKLLSQPYKIHQVSIDLKLDKVLPPMPVSPAFKDDQGQQKSFVQNSTIMKDQRREEGNRDGVLSFELIYMPSIIYCLKMSNISLRTKTFRKQYRMGVRQTMQQRFQETATLMENLIAPKKHQNKKTNTRKLNPQIFCMQLQSYLNQNPQQTQCKQLKLNISGWESYKNQESFSTNPPQLKLQLNNELDGLQIMLQIEVDKQEIKVSEPQQKLPTQKGGLGIFTNLLQNTVEKTTQLKVEDDFEMITDLQKSVDAKTVQQSENDPKKSTSSKEGGLKTGKNLLTSVFKSVQLSENDLSKASQQQKTSQEAKKALNNPPALQNESNKDSNCLESEQKNTITLSYLIPVNKLYFKKKLPKQSKQNYEIIEFKHQTRKYDLKFNYQFIMSKI